MDSFLACARLTIGGVFLVAAASKLLDRERSVTALAELGVPAPLVKPGSIALPAAELLVALGLLFAATAQAGAIGALALLGTFTSAIALAIRRGQVVACHCFGSLRSEPVGGAALIRNAALAVIAAGVASQTAQPAMIGWFAQRSGEDLAVLSLSAALVATVGVAGVSSRRIRVLGHPASAQVPLARDLPIHVVSSGGGYQARAISNEHQLDRVLIDPGRAVANRYGVRRTPAALIIGADGRVASAPESGLPAIEALIRHALATARSN